MPLGKLVAALAERGVDTLGGRGARGGNDSVEFARVERGVLHEQLPQMDVRAEGGGVPARAGGPAGIDPAAVDQPRGEFVAVGTGRVSKSNSGGRGTSDPTPALSVPEALRVMEAMMPRGWPQIMAHNRNLALKGREILGRAWGIEPACPDEMIGAMASIPIGTRGAGAPSTSPLFVDALQEELLAKRRIEAPIIPWPAFPQRLLRISAQVYNSVDQYEALAAALAGIVRGGGVG